MRRMQAAAVRWLVLVLLLVAGVSASGFGATSAEAAPPAPMRQVYVQGDSVMVGAADYVDAALGADGWASRAAGFVGLHTWAALGIFRQLRLPAGSAAVIELGANDCCSGQAFAGSIDDIMGALPGVHVIWLTMPLFRSGAESMNAALEAAPRRWSNLAVADWASVVAADPGLTGRDGIHMAPYGDRRLAAFIDQQLDEWYAPWSGPSRTYATAFGGAPDLGGTGRPESGAAAGGAAASGSGYWVTDSRGDVFTLGTAPFFGAASPYHPAGRIVDMAATPDRLGYWLVGADGGVFSFGDAAFYGGAAGIGLDAPVSGIAATPTGRGYWLVTADGGVFTYGDARFYGAAASMPLRAPVQSITATPDGRGYWEVGADGGVFTYGDAPFYGAGGGTAPAVTYGTLVARPGGGYWLLGQTAP